MDIRQAKSRETR